MKSQLERGSKSHRASVHTCGHPQEKRPMFGQIHVSQRCCVTSLLIHPHQETFCAALQRTARTWAHLELSQQGHDISSALCFIKWPMSNVGGSGVAVSRHFRDKGRDQPPSPASHALSPSSGREVTHPAPCVLLETTPGPKAWLFPQPRGFHVPNSPVFFSPMSNAVFSLTTVTHSSPPSIT